MKLKQLKAAKRIHETWVQDKLAKLNYYYLLFQRGNMHIKDLIRAIKAVVLYATKHEVCITFPKWTVDFLSKQCQKVLNSEHNFSKIRKLYYALNRLRDYVMCANDCLDYDMVYHGVAYLN